jgi:serine/threonine protein kinase
MELPEKETDDSSPTSAASPKIPWANRWMLDNRYPPKGGNQSLVRAVREIDGDRRGALKTLKKPSSSERRARMVREVEILGKLKDVPGISKVLNQNISAGEEEQFIVLEWIDGRSLSDQFTNAVSIGESAEIALKLCTIVQQCHEHGIMHRDIKPDNILISASSNDLWLIDFGIGWTESEDDPFATEINQELGNRFLRLPELHGPSLDSKHDVRSDVTFVCGVFFWLLTHSKPFQLVNEKLEAPHVFQATRFPKDVTDDSRWNLISSIFDVGFAPGVNSRFQAASELRDRLKELLVPPSADDSSDPLKEQDRLLLEFQNKAEVMHRRKIETATMEISNSLLKKLHTMAKDRSLSPLSSGMSYRTEIGIVYFYFALKFADGEPLSSDVCHWIRTTGENESYVEASFGFTNDPRPHTFPSAYYRDSISDITRLRSAVESKANEIFAELLQRLREKHS